MILNTNWRFLQCMFVVNLIFVEMEDFSRREELVLVYKSLYWFHLEEFSAYTFVSKSAYEISVNSEIAYFLDVTHIRCDCDSEQGSQRDQSSKEDLKCVILHSLHYLQPTTFSIILVVHILALNSNICELSRGHFKINYK